jgi:hypothetical protein
VPRGAVSAFSLRVRASRHESAICFESHELDPARILSPPRRRRATHRVARREVVAKGRDWGCTCEPEFACDGELSSAGCFPAPFWLGPHFAGVRLLDPARILCPRAGVRQLIAWLYVRMLRTGVFRVAYVSQNSQRCAGRRHTGCFPAAFGASHHYIGFILGNPGWK